jgi:hypothetical protein
VLCFNSGPTIDWFLPWPKEALVAVSQGVIKDYPIECTPEVRLIVDIVCVLYIYIIGMIKSYRYKDR